MTLVEKAEENIRELVLFMIDFINPSCSLPRKDIENLIDAHITSIRNIINDKLTFLQNEMSAILKSKLHTADQKNSCAQTFLIEIIACENLLSELGELNYKNYVQSMINKINASYVIKNYDVTESLDQEIRYEKEELKSKGIHLRSYDKSTDTYGFGDVVLFEDIYVKDGKKYYILNNGSHVEMSKLNEIGVIIDVEQLA